jgi:hypothetical protein
LEAVFGEWQEEDLPPPSQPPPHPQPQTTADKCTMVKNSWKSGFSPSYFYLFDYLYFYFEPHETLQPIKIK